MFHYFRVSNKFRNERGGVNHDFVSKLLSLTVPKNFVQGALLCFTKFLVSKHFKVESVGEGGDAVSQFSIEIFCFTVPNYFVEEPFRLSLISGMQKFYA